MNDSSDDDKPLSYFKNTKRSRKRKQRNSSTVAKKTKLRSLKAINDSKNQAIQIEKDQTPVWVKMKSNISTFC